jgi:hypothetical protein
MAGLVGLRAQMMHNAHVSSVQVAKVLPYRSVTAISQDCQALNAAGRVLEVHPGAAPTRCRLQVEEGPSELLNVKDANIYCRH